MPPNNCFETRRWRTRPPETEIFSNLLQSVGERREIDPREYKRKKVHRVLDGGRCCRTFAQSAMTSAHTFQKYRLVAAEMHEPRIRGRRKDIKEFFPYPLFSILVVCPKTVLDGLIAGSDANSNQIVEILVGQSFDVQIDGRAVEFRIRKIDGVDFVFADCERSQRMMKFLRFISRASAASARAKRIRKLGSREDTLAMEPFPLLLRHARKRAELVFLDRLLTAAHLEFALATMPVQHKVGRRIVSQKCGDVLDPFFAPGLLEKRASPSAWRSRRRV